MTTPYPHDPAAPQAAAYGRQSGPYGPPPATAAPWGQPQQYGPPPQQYVATPYAGFVDQPKGLSLTSLILGVAGVFLGWTIIVPIVGAILGVIGVRREPAGRGMAIAGIVLNVLGLIVWLLAFLVPLILTGVIMWGTLSVV